MITVQFPIEVKSIYDRHSHTELKTLDTPCENIWDAFEFATEHGHDPNRMIRWWDRDKKENN